MRQFRPATDPAVAADDIGPNDAGRQSSHAARTSHAGSPVEIDLSTTQPRGGQRSQASAAEHLEQAMQAFRTLRSRRRQVSEQDVAVDRLIEKAGPRTLQEDLRRSPK